MELARFSDLFKRTWEMYKKKISVLAVFYAIPFVFSIISALSAKSSTTTTTTGLGKINPWAAAGVGGAVGIIAILVFLATLWIQVGVIEAVNDPDNHPPVPELLKKALPLVLPYLLVSILVGLAVIGGLILLIIPGIIFGIWFSFSSFTLILENQRGTAALKASKALVKGRTGAVFVRFLLVGLLVLVASIPVGIIVSILPRALGGIANSAWSNFVVSPFTVLFAYMLYKELKGKSSAPAAPAAPAATPPAA